MNQPFFRRWFSRLAPATSSTMESEAEHGGADAQFHLGFRYANGEGVAQNYEEAARWYRRAAAQDHALAEFNLGIMYASGHGVVRDDTAAHGWFGKSAGHGDAGAQYHLGVAQHRVSLWGPVPERPEARIEAYKWFRLAAAQGYCGSEAARDSVTLDMSHDDVEEAIRRADRLAPVVPASAAS